MPPDPASPTEGLQSGQAPHGPPLLEVQDLHLSYQGRPILRGVDLTLRRGETLVVLGGSGCGKSTLLRAIIGCEEPARGSIRLQGEDLRALPPHERDERRTRIAMLFQSGALFQSMSVGENIAAVLAENTPLSREEIQILVTMKLEMVGLRHAEHLTPAEISGGMRKRVALARALVLNPLVMLYDEPGAGLDPVTLAGVDRLIVTLGKALGMGSIVVTHELTSALRIAHRVMFLYRGKVRVVGTPEELRTHPDPYLKQFLAGSCEGPIESEEAPVNYARALLGREIAS